MSDAETPKSCVLRQGLIRPASEVADASADTSPKRRRLELPSQDLLPLQPSCEQELANTLSVLQTSCEQELADTLAALQVAKTFGVLCDEELQRLAVVCRDAAAKLRPARQHLVHVCGLPADCPVFTGPPGEN